MGRAAGVVVAAEAEAEYSDIRGVGDGHSLRDGLVNPRLPVGELRAGLLVVWWVGGMVGGGVVGGE